MSPFLFREGNLRFIPSRNLIPLSRPAHAPQTSLRCNPAPMDGVKSFSLGGGAIFRRPARVGCAFGIRVASQPGVPFHNGSRLGCRGRRPALGHVEPPKVVASGDPDLCHSLDDCNLDRETFFSIRTCQPAVCNGFIGIVFSGDARLFTAPKHEILSDKKRGT